PTRDHHLSQMSQVKAAGWGFRPAPLCAKADWRSGSSYEVQSRRRRRAAADYYLRLAKKMPASLERQKLLLLAETYLATAERQSLDLRTFRATGSAGLAARAVAAYRVSVRNL